MFEANTKAIQKPFQLRKLEQYYIVKLEARPDFIPKLSLHEVRGGFALKEMLIDQSSAFEQL